MSEPKKIEISNSYENTEELLKKFPVIHPTPVITKIEKDIQNRLLNGFENWNRGFDAWESWGNILYTPESIYNVHGVRLTLKEYQKSMFATLRQNDIQMGDFIHMLICDDWTAIYYAIRTISRQTGNVTDGSVMEIVNFKDYGGELGTRVVEGWAGTKGADYAGLSYFQTPEEREAQQKSQERIAAKEIPDAADLKEKYPVLYPTTVAEEDEDIRTFLLEECDAWNRSPEEWAEFMKDHLTEDYTDHGRTEDSDRDAYISSVIAEAEGKTVRRICFDNMLIRGTTAAIHYRTSTEDPADGERSAGECMAIIRFVRNNGTLKAAESWTK